MTLIELDPNGETSSNSNHERKELGEEDDELHPSSLEEPVESAKKINILRIPEEDDEDLHSTGMDSIDFDDEDYGGTSELLGEDAALLRDASVSIESVALRTKVFAGIVFILACAASGGFLAFGVNAANAAANESFTRISNELVQIIEAAFRDYEIAALQTHQVCRRSQNTTRADFREFYEYLVAGGLEFASVECNLNVTDEERPALEAESRAFVMENYPALNYRGFHSANETIRPVAPEYFVVHYLEPVAENAGALDLDTYASPSQAREIDFAIATRQPVISARIRLVQDDREDGAYSVIIYHPGIAVSTQQPPESFARELGVIVVRIPFLLDRVAERQEQSLALYLYDKTDLNTQGEHVFLGAADLHHDTRTKVTSVTPLEELAYVNVVQREASEFHYRTFERDIAIASGTWTVVVIPIDSTHDPDLLLVFFGGLMIVFAGVGLALWMLSNLRRVLQVYEAKKAAEADHQIVESLFPAAVLERLKQDARHQQEVKLARARQLHKFGWIDNDQVMFEQHPAHQHRQYMLTSEALFGSKPIADFHPHVTIVCIDLAGFTSWSSVREPSQVLTLLEVIYHYFDACARTRRIFKVEAVGDCYVAAAGVPEARRDHASAVARFATECLRKFYILVQELETNLGPETGDLELRIGIHSGAVTAGVLRGDKGRFQLFGETVNTALAMEAMGQSSQIHISPDTAELLNKAGKGHWLTPRDDKMFVKGRGHIQTYWLRNERAVGSMVSAASSDNISGGDELRKAVKKNKNEEKDGDEAPKEKKKKSAEPPTQKVNKLERLVRWNVAELSKLIQQVVVQRQPPPRSALASSMRIGKKDSANKSKIPLDEVVDVIPLRVLDNLSRPTQLRKDSISTGDVMPLPPEVVSQLTHFVEQIASRYRENPFHNFEHASHVAMSVTKQLSRMKDLQTSKEKDASAGGESKVEDEVATPTDNTFGITSDPMIPLAAFVAALIHDVDHPGVPNPVLMAEDPVLAAKYRHKSVAEQNSVDLSWDLFLQDRYKVLRQCLFQTTQEMGYFRHLLLNMVMATDVMDKDLNALRKDRWNKAFASDIVAAADGDILDDDSPEHKANRKATIVLEHLIQASDVSHTMQHFHIYRKWNECLFVEIYHAYCQGRSANGQDPSVNWYRGELGFLEFYVLPLAQKLDTCGVFGVSSDEFRFYAMENIREWTVTGEELVADYLRKYRVRFAGQNPSSASTELTITTQDSSEEECETYKNALNADAPRLTPSVL